MAYKEGCNYASDQPGIVQSSQLIFAGPSSGFRPQATKQLMNAFVSFISSWAAFQSEVYSWLVHPSAGANHGLAEFIKIWEFSRQRLPKKK